MTFDGLWSGHFQNIPTNPINQILWTLNMIYMLIMVGLKLKYLLVFRQLV